MRFSNKLEKTKNIPNNQGQESLPTATPTQMQKLKVIGWIPYWDQKNAFASFSKNIKSFDLVSVFWYRINGSGNVTTYKETVEDKAIIDFAHQNNVKVMAVIANLPDYEEGGDWDWQRVNKAISTEAARDRHILQIIDLVNNKNLDGVDIDYEALKAEQREDFSLFIEKLADRLHQNGKLLGVAIHPKTSENNPQEDNGSHAQDLTRIAKSADQMYFMTYTEHSISSQPGSVGSIDWVNKVMGYALDELKLPKEKLFFGIGLFGLEWQQGAGGHYEGVNDDLTFPQIQSLVADNNVKIERDDNTKSSYFNYQEKDKKHVVWFEDGQSFDAKINLARELRVGGLGFWRLGSEDPVVWEKVSGN